MTPRAFGALQTLVSAACFGAMAVLARGAYAEGVDVLALLFLRFGIAGAVMAIAMRVRRTPWPRGRSLWVLAAMGGIGYVSQSISFFSALHYATAALVALLLYLHPFMITIASRLIYRRPMGRVRLISVVLALLGTALVIGQDLSGELPGYLLGVCAALIYSIYLMTGQRVLDGAVPPMAAAAVVMLAAAVVLGGLNLIWAPSWPRTATAWGAVLAIALVSTVMAMLLLFSGIRHLGAADAATLSTLEPVVTAVLGVALLNESLTALQWAGGAVVLAAVIVLTRWGERTVTKQEKGAHH